MNARIGSRLVIYWLIFFVVSGFFWNYYFLFDLFSHFYLQLFVICCIFIPWYVWRKYWTEVALSVLLGSFFLFHLVGSDFSGIYGRNVIVNPDLFYMNSEYMNKDIESIAGYIQEVRPKQIALVELNKELFEKIKREWGYKYSYYYSNSVFSFWFFTNEEVLEQQTYFSNQYPIGYFRTPTKSYYVIHPLPPMSDELYREQKKFFTDLSELIKDKGDFMLVGDFNSTAYSMVFQKHFWKYFYESIYSWWVGTILTIPIDHAVSDKKLDIHPGARLSSDHIPLLISFQ